MSLTEFLCCLIIAAIGMGCVMVFSGKLIADYTIKLSKVELDSFLERQRLHAALGSKPVEIFYDYRSRKLNSTSGDTIEECEWLNLENFKIRFGGNGSIAILSGSTTLYYENGSILTIQPVTGKVTY